jgi:6-phosphogluconolactonase
MPGPRLWRLVVLLPMLVSCAAAGGRRAAPPAGAASGGAESAPAEPAGRTFVYVGLAGGSVAGFHLDLATGALVRRGAVDVGRSPSSLVRSAERETIVAVDDANATAVALAVNAKTGALAPTGRAPAGGPQPSGAAVDATGKYVLVAHPGAGNVSVLAITPDRKLGSIGTFAAGAGASAVALHPANQLAFVTNLRASTISQFSFNTGTGILTPKAGPPLALPAGSGPVRLACHPSGRWVYVLDEVSDTVSVHMYDVDLKALSALSSQIVPTLPEGHKRGKSRPADLALGRGGRFLYVTNHGDDSVAIFAIAADGTLQAQGHVASGGHGAGPIAVDPSGAFLFVGNQVSKTLAVFRLDPTTGAPESPRTVALPGAPLALLVAAL